MACGCKKQAPPEPAPASSPAAIPAAFLGADYERINKARMEHLAGLGLLKPGMRVLEVGSGPCMLTRWLLDWGCEVIAVEGRPENARHCDGVATDFYVCDVLGDLPYFGPIDAVFCYGLLYHLPDPARGIRNMASVGASLFLLETIVTDTAQDMVHMDRERRETPSQSMTGIGSRPSPAWVVRHLHEARYRWVYAPVTPPRHEEYEWEPLDTGRHKRNGHNLRRVFVASQDELHNDKLRGL